MDHIWYQCYNQHQSEVGPTRLLTYVLHVLHPWITHLTNYSILKINFIYQLNGCIILYGAQKSNYFGHFNGRSGLPVSRNHQCRRGTTLYIGDNLLPSLTGVEVETGPLSDVAFPSFILPSSFSFPRYCALYDLFAEAPWTDHMSEPS